MPNTQADWEYPVVLRELTPVEDPDNHVLRTRLATIDEGSGEILGLVSPRYQLIQNKQLHDAIGEITGDLGLGLEKVSVVKDKRATIFRYNFGADRIQTVANSATLQDTVGFGVEVINSFDSSLGASRFVAFAKRLVCTNGLTIPKEVGRITFKELGPLTSTNIKDKLAARIGPILNTVDIWNQWAQVTPSRSRIGEFMYANFSKKRAALFLESYDNNLPDKSIWGVYNLLTYYITHEAKCRNAEDIRMKQFSLENTVSKLYKISLN